MTARNLSIAIMEAIQAHADRHHGGKRDLDRTLSALGDLASGFLAELRTQAEIRAHYGALVKDIAQQTARKLADEMRSPTTH
jgi:hypothetical protein